MALGFFRRRPQEAVAPAVAPQPVMPADIVAPASVSESDSAREILELLELELGAMIRQLERAANSVAGGAEATAVTLSTITPPHRRPDGSHQFGAEHRDHVRPGRRQVHPLGGRHRIPGARRQ